MSVKKTSLKEGNCRPVRPMSVFRSYERNKTFFRPSPSWRQVVTQVSVRTFNCAETCEASFLGVSKESVDPYTVQDCQWTMAATLFFHRLLGSRQVVTWTNCAGSCIIPSLGIKREHGPLRSPSSPSAWTMATTQSEKQRGKTHRQKTQNPNKQNNQQPKKHRLAYAYERNKTTINRRKNHKNEKKHKNTQTNTNKITTTQPKKDLTTLPHSALRPTNSKKTWLQTQSQSLIPKMNHFWLCVMNNRSSLPKLKLKMTSQDTNGPKQKNMLIP